MSNVYIKTKVRSGKEAMKYLGKYKNKTVLIVCDKFMAENGSVKTVINAIDSTSAEERAKRRYKQLQNKGINGNFAQILAEIQERDFRDRNREVAPLNPADDALLLDSTTLSIDEVISQALAYIQQKASISI